MKFTQAKLKSILTYDEDTGLFHRRIDRRKFKAGERAGYFDPSSGYIRIGVEGILYMAHRLVFLYMEGYMPENEVDHKDGCTWNNRYLNLREVTDRCQQQNRKVSKRNKSGFTGVLWHKQNQKWRAYVTVDRKQIMLGMYDCVLDAALARYTFEDWCPEWQCDLRNENRQKVRNALNNWLAYKLNEET